MGTTPPTISLCSNYKKGNQNVADVLPCLVLQKTIEKTRNMTEEYVNFVIQNSTPNNITLRRFAKKQILTYSNFSL